MIDRVGHSATNIRDHPAAVEASEGLHAGTNAENRFVRRRRDRSHRTVATYLSLLVRSSFSITRIDEWSPAAVQVAAKPELALERERPLFLLVAAKRAA